MKHLKQTPIMRYTLFFSMFLMAAMAVAQTSGPQRTALFLLKIADDGSIISSKVTVPTETAYGYFVSRAGNEILVHGFIRDSIGIDSLHYGVSENDSFPGHVTLYFDTSLVCKRILASTSIPLNQSRNSCQGSEYCVSTITGALRIEDENIPNVGGKDIQVSVFENETLKWNRIVGSVYNDVPYSIFYDSMEGNYYVTGFISYPDSSEQDYRLPVARERSATPFRNSDKESMYGSPAKPSQNDLPAYVIHPNPFSDHIDVRIGGLETEEELTYRLFEAKGALVRTGMLPKGSNRISGLDDLPPGTYYLSLRDANNKEVSRTKVIRKTL